MERDFMGLNSKDQIAIKPEFVDSGCEDSGFARSSGVPWSWPIKPSSLPPYLSLKCEQAEKSSKINSDLLASHAYIAKSGSELFEAMHKRQSGDIKNGHSAHPIHDVKMHPFSLMSPFQKTPFTGSYQNFGGYATMKEQFLDGLSAPSIFPSSSPSVATDQQWNSSKDSNAPTQMTIFYGGAVNVFDDITPEKAQAIIFLAGNGCVPSNMAQSKLHMQTPASKFQAEDKTLVNQSMNLMPPSSSLPSPMSISGAYNDENIASKTAGMSTPVVNKVDPSKVLSPRPIRSVAASAMMSSVVPLARKASLARFLEKRKERAMSGAPYNLNKIASDCAPPESNEFGFSASSGISSTSISIGKRDS